VQLGHFLGPCGPEYEYQDADVMKVLERLALLRKEKEDTRHEQAVTRPTHLYAFSK